MMLHLQIISQRATYKPHLLSPDPLLVLQRESEIVKYSSLSDELHFVPAAIETSVVLGQNSLQFLTQIGHKAALERHEPGKL